VQPAGLLRHAEQRKDVRQAEGVDGAFESHGSLCGASGGG
jgi:hypothetical protein